MKKYYRKVEFFTFLLILLGLLGHSALYAQQGEQVSIRLKDKPLSVALKEVEKQTDYVFVYSATNVNVTRKVTVELQNAPLKEALNQILSPLGVVYKIDGKNINLTQGKGKKITVTGQVLDEMGKPFPYVDVRVKGNTALGTFTDMDGKYSLTLPDSNVELNYTIIGYKTLTEFVGTKSVINCKMKVDEKLLDDVVVVAFGTQKKSSISSAVSVVKSEEILKAPVSNISNAIGGKVAGVISMQGSGQPGADEATLYIRGAGTWNNAEPLYVIDGIENNQSQFLRVDPNEVESISILKDAAATALYGSKAANGVVVLTTKRGEKGKVKVTLNASVTLTQPTRHPEYLNSYESLKLYNEALENDGQDPVYSYEDLEHYRLQDDPLRYPDTDWYALMMKKVAPQVNASLTVRGGTDRVRYFIAGTYMYQDGQLKIDPNRVYNPKFFYQRYTFRSNVDVLLTDAFTLSLNLGGGITDRSKPYDAGAVWREMNRMPSWIMPAKNPDGTYAGTSEYTWENPMHVLNTYGDRRDKNNTITSSLTLRYDFNKLVKGLEISARVAYDSNFGNYKYWYERVITQQLISQPGRADRYKSFEDYEFPAGGYSANSATRKLYGEGKIQWHRQYGDHTVGVQGIANISTYKPGSSIPYNSVSFIARANYSYAQRYSVEVNAAYRGSENFAPGRRFGLFPSASLAWNIHKEPWMKNVKFINNLKLRASYGITGSDYASDRFIYVDGKWSTGTGYYAKFGPAYGYSNGYTYEADIANPLATWETAYQGNVGLDFTFFKNRFTITVDKFFETREGILMSPNSIPGILGIGVTDMNIGKTKKDGWEGMVSYSQNFGRDWNFHVSGNITYARNKVVYKDEPDDKVWYHKEEGRPIGQTWGYQVIGFFKDQEDIDNSPVQRVGNAPIPGDFKYLDFDNNGEINEMDRIPIGYPSIPQLFYGFSIGASWKNLSLDLFFQGTAMSSVFISDYLMYEFYNRGKVQGIHQGRWTPATAETATYPALHIGGKSQNHTRNTFFLKDNPYLRLKNIELAYAFYGQKLKKAGISNISVYLRAVNVCTWDKLKVVDPETPSGSTGSIYPQTRGYSFGFNIAF